MGVGWKVAVKIIKRSQGKVKGLFGIGTVGVSKLVRLTAQEWEFSWIPTVA